MRLAAVPLLIYLLWSPVWRVGDNNVRLAAVPLLIYLSWSPVRRVGDISR